MPEPRTLTAREYTQLQSGLIPALRFSCDQWGEYGYFYDPIAGQFASYDIDRKCQTDGVWAVGDAAQLLATCEVARRDEVQAWLDAMPAQPCARCVGYFGAWRSHGPSFPEDAFEIVEHEDVEVGTHAAVLVMQGTARCRGCGLFAAFGCDYGAGYWLEPRPARRG